MPCPNAARRNLTICTNKIRVTHFRFSIFPAPVYDISMPEHIEDIQHRYDELKKRMELVRSYL
jgi:hypothetical protein